MVTRTGIESGGSVTVCVYETDTDYRVKVSDNGVGFDPALQTDGKQHIGIKNIRERVSAMCGGRLTIDSAPGKKNDCCYIHSEGECVKPTY
ncbi:MAG: ATP-binding protein [Ruminiclostridium sp.]